MEEHTQPAQRPLADLFDVSREYILTHPMPPMQLGGGHLTHSTTGSVHRLHWNSIHLWHGFDDLVRTYWAHVPQFDKEPLVTQEIFHRDAMEWITDIPVWNEALISFCIEKFPVFIHSAAANGHRGANRPSDRHSKFVRWPAEGCHLDGAPDFAMVSEDELAPRVTVTVEVKTPWMVTPLHIAEVLDGMISIIIT
jgi:hypothetical protein